MRTLWEIAQKKVETLSPEEEDAVASATTQSPSLGNAQIVQSSGIDYYGCCHLSQ